MVEMALHELAEKNVLTLDDERKATMVSNLMVVLCGESEFILWSTPGPFTREPAALVRLLICHGAAQSLSAANQRETLEGIGILGAAGISARVNGQIEWILRQAVTERRGTTGDEPDAGDT
jgi:hypothetical protein